MVNRCKTASANNIADIDTRSRSACEAAAQFKFRSRGNPRSARRSHKDLITLLPAKSACAHALSAVHAFARRTAVRADVMFWVNVLTVIFVTALGIDLLMLFANWVKRQHREDDRPRK
jgi:hypothetical protein